MGATDTSTALRPALNWTAVVEGIRAHGIRNWAQMTVAPTGTIATVARCEGYGCEPVFALAYTRRVKEKEGDVMLTYKSPLFEAALNGVGIMGMCASESLTRSSSVDHARALQNTQRTSATCLLSVGRCHCGGARPHTSLSSMPC